MHEVYLFYFIHYNAHFVMFIVANVTLEWSFDIELLHISITLAYALDICLNI
jgi:hypothetical protein